MEGSAHELHELACDGEAEAGAAVGAWGGGVGLGIGLEEAAEGFGGDADAGVLAGDGKDLGAVGVGGRGGGEGGEETDVAVAGELDGVGGEIGEDLLEAEGIADEVGCVGGEALDGPCEALVVGERGEEAVEVVEEGVGVEGLGVEDELAGVDLGEVEGVVDEVGEGAAGGGEALDEGAGLVGEREAAEELEEAVHGVHGGAHLVAHVGEEVGAGATGLGEGGIGGGELGGAATDGPAEGKGPAEGEEREGGCRHGRHGQVPRGVPRGWGDLNEVLGVREVKAYGVVGVVLLGSLVEHAGDAHPGVDSRRGRRADRVVGADHVEVRLAAQHRDPKVVDEADPREGPHDPFRRDPAEVHVEVPQLPAVDGRAVGRGVGACDVGAVGGKGDGEGPQAGPEGGDVARDGKTLGDDLVAGLGVAWDGFEVDEDARRIVLNEREERGGRRRDDAPDADGGRGGGCVPGAEQVADGNERPGLGGAVFRFAGNEGIRRRHEHPPADQLALRGGYGRRDPRGPCE